MRNNFKFKNKNNKFIWESSSMILEFSNPSIQGYSSFLPLKNREDIMYYYYTVRIFKKVSNWNGKTKKVKLVGETTTHDFPVILELEFMLKNLIKENITKYGQKIRYRNDKERYAKTLATEGFACDDFYEITRNVNEDNVDDYYNVYCGVSLNADVNLNSNGIRIGDISKKDVLELLKCVSGFIDYSIEESNKFINQDKYYFEICSTSSSTKINSYSYKNDVLDKEIIKSIYDISDKLDIVTIVGDNEFSYYGVSINSIKQDTLLLNNHQSIDKNTIVDISNSPTEEMLKYKEAEIAKDFLSVLSDNEKEEFKDWEIERLVMKYENAIIDRTWLCREEHQFNIDYVKGDRLTQIKPIVLELIKTIKERV